MDRQSSPAHGPNQKPGSSRALVVTSAASVEPKPVRWCWQGRIPLGCVSVLAGREGLGKSTLAIELAAQVTRGELVGDLAGTPASVTYAGPEDAHEFTVVPRLIAAGADRKRIDLIDGTTDDGSSRAQDGLSLPGDIGLLEEAARTTGTKLLVLDPLVSFLPGEINTHRDSHVRRALSPLAALASELDLAVIGVMHLNKSESTDALKRLNGSVGFGAFARSVLLFGPDPEDENGETGRARIVAHAKCNVAPKAPSLSLRVESRTVAASGQTLSTSGVVLLGESEQTPGDLLNEPLTSDERSQRDEAVDFLRHELAEEPTSVQTLKVKCDEAGLSWRTVERAKRRANALSFKRGSAWFWELKTASSLATTSGGVDGVGGVGPGGEEHQGRQERQSTGATRVAELAR